MKKTYFDENLQKFCINFDEHGRHYHFFNAREVVSEFLTVFENIFILRSNLRQVSFKCTFIIVNCQPAPRVGFVELPTVGCGKPVCMMGCILMIMSRQIWREIF